MTRAATTSVASKGSKAENATSPPISSSKQVIGPSVVECAELASAVYDMKLSVRVGDVVFKRTRVSKKTPSGKGFQAALYQAPQRPGIVAIAGSNDFDEDVVIDDAHIFLGRVPPQFFDTLDFIHVLGVKSSDYLVGHSLGGALALLGAVHQRCAAVSFNAPGVQDECIASTRQLGVMAKLARACQYNPRVYNVRLDWDSVSSEYSTGKQVGSKVTSLSFHTAAGDLAQSGSLLRKLPLKAALAATLALQASHMYEAHLMRNMIPRIRANPGYLRPLNL